MYVMKVPVLSSSHLSPVGTEFLDTPARANLLGIVATYEHGWFIFVGSDSSWFDHMEDLPPDLRKILDWALEHQYEWLRIDTHAGDTIDELPTYDEEWS